MKIGTDGFSLPVLFVQAQAGRPQAEAKSLSDLLKDERVRRMLSN